jgi:beta-glucanase (GH16 family)
MQTISKKAILILISCFGFLGSCKKETQAPCVALKWYEDKDNDGLGNKAVIMEMCEKPAGYVYNPDDDNDNVAKAPPSLIPTTGLTSPSSYPNLKLLWADEFEGKELNEKFWNYEIGNNNGWGNNELQYYKKENTTVKDGYLLIEAKRDIIGSQNYSSSRLTTQNKFNFKYGRMDIRAAMPKGQGVWPALWLLGKNITTVNWPKCGEIDIMEMIGGEATGRDNTSHATAHWDNNGKYAAYSGNTKLASGKLNDAFRVYSLVWDAKKITWLLDDVKYHEIDITPEGLSEFQEEFFLLFNVAVGGNWPGNPDGSTILPQYMIVDYVRVFQ